MNHFKYTKPSQGSRPKSLTARKSLTATSGRTPCGKPNCACARGQKHGPFYYLVANLGVGRILKSLLKTPAQQQTVQRGVAGYQAHWERLEELSQINLELLRRGEPLGGPRP
jgi:hypothetical protein